MEGVGEEERTLRGTRIGIWRMWRAWGGKSGRRRRKVEGSWYAVSRSPESRTFLS